MRSSRVLSFVVSLCIIFGTTFGATSVNATFNVPTLEDMEINPWEDLNQIQGAEPQEPPELVDPIVNNDPPFTYALSGGGDWTLKTNTGALWVTITEDGYGGDNFWSSTETFPPGEPFVDLDYITYDGARFVGGIIGTYADTWISIETYNQTYANGEFSLVGDVYGALAIRLGHPSDTVGVGYLYPNSVEIIAKTRYSDLVSLGTWSLENGRVSIDDVVTLPETVLSLTYKFYFANETKEIRPGGVDERINLSYFFTDGLSLSEYVPEDEDTGLLRGILAWLQSILEAIISLPGRVADAILDGLYGLFVPSAEDITDMRDRYQELLSTRLGFIYQGFELVVTWWTEWLETMKSAQDYSFVFPGISFPYNGELVVIVPEQSVSLDNAVMDILRPILGTVFAMVCTVAFINTAFEMTIALISGESYFAFINRRKEEEAL